jgi:enoyl-CoA hydratase/carnithine racemase
MTDAVLYHADSRVGVITLNRPDNRNSMTPELLDAFVKASAAARDDHDIRALVITGKGSCFSAGADFKSDIQRHRDQRPREAHERSFAMYEPFMSILEIEVPVIGALNGHAVGGGFGLSLMCDIRIANRDSKYGANFTRLGIHPGMAVTYLLPRLVGISNAAEMLFTGRLLLGREAAEMGLVTRAVAADEVLGSAMELAKNIAANAPTAVRMTKRTLYDLLGWDVRGAAWREAFAQAMTIDSDEAQEGIAALLEKRDPQF